MRPDLHVVTDPIPAEGSHVRLARAFIEGTTDLDLEELPERLRRRLEVWASDFILWDHARR